MTRIYLNHSKVAVFGISAEVKYIPLDINSGWEESIKEEH